MSDARAKAEARRAKILARDSSKKVQAIGDDLTLPVDGTPVERPLARRRQLVESLAEKSANAEESTPVKGSAPDDGSDPTTPVPESPGLETPVKEVVVAKTPVNTDDPDVETIEQLEEKHSATKATVSSSQKSGLLKALSPKKSLAEIEAEVARNTAQYDADTMKGEPISKTKRTSRDMKDATSQAKKAVITSNNVNPTNVTRLIRMFVIILLGSYKGYRVVQDNILGRDRAMIEAMEGYPATNVVSFDEFGDRLELNAAERLLESDPASYNAAGGAATTATAKPTRTWVEYAQYKATAPFESTLTAVGVSYWIASMLSAGINSRLKAPPKSKGIMEQLLALYQSGFEGILERVFCALGEYALHLGTILIVAIVLTLYTEIPAVGGDTSNVASAVASVVNSVVGGEGSVQSEL